MDSNQTKRQKPKLPPFIQHMLVKEIPDPDPEQIDAMEIELAELDMIDDVLRHVATGLVVQHGSY